MKVFLSLVFHNHQPVGNFHTVFEEAYEKAYAPLLAALERHPQIRVGLHVSGSLRDWLLQHQPEYIRRVRALVERGQLEPLGGGYYEPILVMLSDEDKIGQIDALSKAVMQDTGVQPTGMWLAERVWEQALARPIAQAGLKYALVDDAPFLGMGLREEDLSGHYLTEEQGYPLALLPISRQVRGMIPFRNVDVVMAYLRGIAERPLGDNPPPLVLLGDDGEKFGLWQGSYKRCWTDRYIDDLFDALASANWIEMVRPGDYVARFPALGRAYLPSMSYPEIGEWSLPAPAAQDLITLRKGIERDIDQSRHNNPPHAAYLERISRYLRGGFWRGFLVKYPEANHLHKRVMHTSRRVHALRDAEKKQQALQHVWAAQSNTVYWHGLYGGVYLFHLRAANYAHLLAAEALLADNKVRALQTDFDFDSREELLVSAQPFSLIFDLARGGALIEWDDLPARYNILNVITRRHEGYHADLERGAARGTLITPASPRWTQPDDPVEPPVRAKESGLEKRLFYDWHRRGAFIDHFLHHDTKLEHFQSAIYGEEGDFVLGAYTAQVRDNGKKTAAVTLSRDGHVWAAGVHTPVHVEKRFSITSGQRELIADYAVTNQGEALVTLRFGVEVCYGFDGGNTEQCYLALAGQEKIGNLGEQGVVADMHSYAVGTYLRGFEIALELNKVCELWRFPLEPVTQSESGFERIHQGVVFLHLWTLKLKAGQTWKNRMRFVGRDISR